MTDVHFFNNDTILLVYHTKKKDLPMLSGQLKKISSGNNAYNNYWFLEHDMSTEDNISESLVGKIEWLLGIV